MSLIDEVVHSNTALAVGCDSARAGVPIRGFVCDVSRTRKSRASVNDKTGLHSESDAPFFRVRPEGFEPPAY